MRTKLLLIFILIIVARPVFGQDEVFNLTADEYLKLGVEYYDAGDPVIAIETFREALRDTTYQDRATLHLFIGIAYLFPTDTIRTNDAINMALWEFDTALGIDSGFAEAHYWKGKAKELIADTVAAIEEYRTATKLNRKYAEAWNQWGVLLYSQGDYRGASEKFKKAIFCELKNPAYNATFHFNLYLAYYARGWLSESADEMEKARKLNANITADSRVLMSRPMILKLKQLNGASKP